MESLVSYIVSNGDLKILVLILAWIGWNGMRQITKAIDRIREDIDQRVRVDICDERHGGSCRRLDELEKTVSKNSFSIAEIKGVVHHD